MLTLCIVLSFPTIPCSISATGVSILHLRTVRALHWAAVPTMTPQPFADQKQDLVQRAPIVLAKPANGLAIQIVIRPAINTAMEQVAAIVVPRQPAINHFRAQIQTEMGMMISARRMIQILVLLPSWAVIAEAQDALLDVPPTAAIAVIVQMAFRTAVKTGLTAMEGVAHATLGQQPL